MKRLSVCCGILLFLISTGCTTCFSTDNNSDLNDPQQFIDGPEARNKLARQVRQLFHDEKFAELDAIAKEFRESKNRFSDGAWKLDAFFSIFDLATDEEEDNFLEYIRLAGQWRQDHPTSVSAQNVLAKAWMDYAWKERGGGYAREVREEAWPIVYERIDKAWEVVNEPLASGIADCPHRLSLRLRVALVKGLDRATFEDLFQEAVEKEPEYYRFYLTKAFYLLPRWHGMRGEWQQFFNEIVEKNPKGEGMVIYARTAWQLYRHLGWKDFEDDSVSWEKMRTGFLRILQDYPESDWIANVFARFACLAGDKDTIVDLFKRVDLDHYKPEAWGDESVDACRTFAGFRTFAEISVERFDQAVSDLDVMVFNEILNLAEQGNREAIVDLARMYLKGEGTSPDPIAAYAWFAQDETANEHQLTDIVKDLTADQLQRAKGQAESIRARINATN